MSEKNRYGLTRDVPESVKREVRQRCGFGCVLCGNALVHYDHFDPPFSECPRHTADGITLLCGRHHDQKNKGLLASQSVIKANSSPHAKRVGRTQYTLDLGDNGHPTILVGTNVFVGCSTILRVAGDDILGIQAPEMLGGPFRLDASFSDNNGDPILKIANNEWMASAGSWDVRLEGPRVTIRRARSQLALVICVYPPSRIDFERISMLHRGCRIEVRSGGLTRFIQPDGTEHTLRGSLANQAEVAVDFSMGGILVGIRALYTQLGEVGYRPATQVSRRRVTERASPTTR
jgi:hypothetical protein